MLASINRAVFVNPPGKARFQLDRPVIQDIMARPAGHQNPLRVVSNG
jgi:hypothetical protein